jgi:hypothetical protein
MKIPEMLFKKMMPGVGKQDESSNYKKRQAYERMFTKMFGLFNSLYNDEESEQIMVEPF